MSPVAGLNIKLFVFLQKYRSRPSLTTYVHFQSQFFSTYRQNSKKSSVTFLGEDDRIIVLFFVLSISSGLRVGASRLASPKTEISTSSDSAGRPIAAGYTCSTGAFRFSHYKDFNCLYWGQFLLAMQ